MVHDLAVLPDPATLGLVALAAAVGSLLSALTGSGAGVVLSAALLPVVGVRAVVPILSVAMVVSHIGRLHAFRRDVDWRAGTRLIVLSLPGNIAGTLTYSRLPEQATAIVLGTFLLALLALRIIRPALKTRLPPPAFAIAALAFGFLNGLTIGAGVLVIPLLLAAGLRGAALVATDALVGLAMNLLKAVALGLFGSMTPAMVLSGIVVGVVMLPGAFIARRLIGRLTLGAHDRLIDGTIAFAALAMLWRAATLN